MKLQIFIAKRYLFSHKKKTFINIISILSVLSVTIITAALIVVLSVFNGLEHLLFILNNSFDPEIKVEVVKGKSFSVNDHFLDELKKIEGVEIITEVIEDYAYIKYLDANQVITLKGVSKNFIDQHRIDHAIIQGELVLQEGHTPYALVGVGIVNSMSINIGEKLHALHVYYIKNIKSGTLDPSKLYSQKSILPGASFSIMQNFDDNYVIVPLEFAKNLLNYEDKRTSLEIKTTAGANIYQVEKLIQEHLGKDFKVLNQQEQHRDLYKLLKMEKFVAFTFLTILLAIGSINIFFTLSMFALDKKKDISIISAMGATQKNIREIFLIEGGLIALLGTVLGLVLGGGLCFLQDQFSLLSMGMESAVVEGYPVKMIWQDFLYVLIVMFFITFLTSYRPAMMASRLASLQHL